MSVGQTREIFGEFAPYFAELNDNAFFGKLLNSDDRLCTRDMSLVAVTALMSQGITDASFKQHLQSAKMSGITREEIAKIIMHAAFYSGWPKAWAAFRIAKDIWIE